MVSIQEVGYVQHNTQLVSVMRVLLMKRLFHIYQSFYSLYDANENISRVDVPFRLRFSRLVKREGKL